MMSVFSKIAYDQDKIMKLIHDIEMLGDEDSQLREPLFTKLKKEIFVLIRAEEQVFYSELESYRKTEKLVNSLHSENADILNLLMTLCAKKLNTKAWHEVFSELAVCVFGHIEKEQNKLFPKAEDLLSSSEADCIEARLVASKEECWEAERQVAASVSLMRVFVQNVRVAV